MGELTFTEYLQCWDKVTVTDDGQRQKHVEGDDAVDNDDAISALLRGQEVPGKLFHGPRRAVDQLQQVSRSGCTQKHQTRLQLGQTRHNCGKGRQDSTNQDSQDSTTG